jgi:hypothetical protein
MMANMQKIAKSRPLTWMGAVLGLLIMVMPALGQTAAQPKKTGIEEVKPLAGQQMCPPVTKGQCQMRIDCPPIKAPGKTVCQATIDCPPVKEKKQEKK